MRNLTDDVQSFVDDDSATVCSTGSTVGGAEGDDARVNVFLRLRPMSKLETSRRSRSCVEVHEGSEKFTVNSHLDGEYDFCYDRVRRDGETVI
eukprot:3066119-Ditylum_brightwellii.AAC.1